MGRPPLPPLPPPPRPVLSPDSMEAWERDILTEEEVQIGVERFAMHNSELETKSPMDAWDPSTPTVGTRLRERQRKK